MAVVLPPSGIVVLYCSTDFERESYPVGCRHAGRKGTIKLNSNVGVAILWAKTVAVVKWLLTNENIKELV